MALDLPTFASKLARVRQMFDESLPALSLATGIPEERLSGLESAVVEPSGDEVLIVADHFAINFRFFISNESELSVDRAEKLFRAYAKELTTQDRLAVQEFLTLCENEAFLLRELGRSPLVKFRYAKHGTFYKGHGIDGAKKFRDALGYAPTTVPDIFGDIRKVGIRVFRRRLANRDISGLFIQDDAAGPCVLVNYNEDVYRQRFTAAHETAHALFDTDDGYVVSFTKWNRDDLREVRANAFAGAYLVPPDLVQAMPSSLWSEKRFIDLAEQLQVNPAVLALALRQHEQISEPDFDSLKQIRFGASEKSDPELPASLTKTSKERKKRLLERGISSFYVNLCIEAYQAHLVTRARLAEMMFVDANELSEILSLFGIKEAP